MSATDNDWYGADVVLVTIIAEVGSRYPSNYTVSIRWHGPCGWAWLQFCLSSLDHRAHVFRGSALTHSVHRAFCRPSRSQRDLKMDPSVIESVLAPTRSASPTLTVRHNFFN